MRVCRLLACALSATLSSGCLTGFSQAAPKHPFPALPASEEWNRASPGMALPMGEGQKPARLRLGWDTQALMVHVIGIPAEGQVTLRIAETPWRAEWKGSAGTVTLKDSAADLSVDGTDGDRGFLARIPWRDVGLKGVQARRPIPLNITWRRPDGMFQTFPSRGRGVFFLNDTASVSDCADTVGTPLRFRFEPRNGKPRIIVEPDPDSGYCAPAEIIVRSIGESPQADRVVKTVKTEGPTTVEAPAIPGARAVSLSIAPVVEGVVQGASEYRALPSGTDIETYTGDPDWKRPADWEAFWKRAKADLAKVPMNPRITEVKEKATATGRLYRVELDSVDSVTIVCWYYVPKDVDVLAGKTSATYPAVQRMPGYGGAQPERDSTDIGWISLAVNPRGHGPSGAFWPLPGNHMEHNINNAETYYYRGAYLDCLRAMEFLRSRPEVDQERIGTEGSSQGGALSLATAALDGKVAACVAYVPFLSSFPDAVRLATGGGFSTLRTRFEALDSEEGRAIRRSVSYIDARFMAEQIQCPTHITINLMDRICPPPTGFADLNSLPAGTVKEVSLNPTLDHELTEGMLNAGMAFFQKHLR